MPKAIRPGTEFDNFKNYTGPLPDIIQLSLEIAREYPFSTPLHEFGIAVTFFFPALAFLAVVLRMVSRRMTKQYGWDDALIILALLVSIGGTFPMYYYMKTNFQGMDPKLRPKLPYPYNAAPFFNIFWVQVLFPAAVWLVKASFIHYIQPLGATKPGFRLTCRILLVVTYACMITTLFGTVFQTVPVQRLWFRSVDGVTMHYAPFAMTMASMNILTDIASLTLPAWIFTKMHYHWRAKVALIVVFSLGLTVTAVSLVRLYFLYKIFYAVSMDQISIATVAYPIEACLAIVTASLPPLWPLFRRWFPNLFSRLGISRPWQQPQLRELTQPTYLEQEVPPIDTTPAKKTSKLARFFGSKKTGGSTVQLTNKDGSWPSQSSARGVSSRGGLSEDGGEVAPPEVALTKRNTDIMQLFEEQRQQSNEHYRRIWGGEEAPEVDTYHMHVRNQARTEKFGV